MLRRIKYAFDEAGIEIPLPHRVIYQRNDANGGELNRHLANAIMGNR